MLQQKVSNRQPTALQGVGLVALILLAAVAGSAFFSLMSARLGALASVGFIAYGCAIAWLLLNWYGMSFVYTATPDCLRVCRAYGKRERFLADVWLNRIVAAGSLEAMKGRCPGARVTQATKAQCAYEPLALAYKDSDGARIIVIQPNDEMRKFLLEKIRQ